MTISKSVIAGIFILLLGFSSCKKEKADPVIPNEPEVITTLKYTLTPNDGGDAVVLSFLDLDGDGGDAPIITGGTLDANKTYSGALVLLNEQETPAGNTTEEIQEEHNVHQFFFQTTIAGLTVAYDDVDDNGHPVGLQSTLTTTGAGNGTLTVTLRHEPDKYASGVPEGDITNAGGETDIEVTFDVTVE